MNVYVSPVALMAAANSLNGQHNYSQNEVISPPLMVALSLPSAINAVLMSMIHGGFYEKLSKLRLLGLPGFILLLVQVFIVNAPISIFCVVQTFLSLLAGG